MASLTVLEAQRGNLQSRINDLVSTLTSAQENLTRLETRKALTPENQRAAIEGNIASLKSQIAQDSAQLTVTSKQLADIDAQILELQTAATLPSQSTGQTVANAQTARDDSASPTNPPPPPETVIQGSPQVGQGGRIINSRTPVPTNAEKFALTTDAGTNDRDRPQTETQSIPPPTARTPIPATEEEQKDAFWTQTIGSRAPTDDATPGDNGVKAELNRIFGSQKRLVPTSNPLDKFASYTYNISIYIMSPAQYKKLLISKQRDLAGWQLLMQSGGAPVTTGASLPPDFGQYADTAAANVQQLLATQGRNQFFPLDFYIDDVHLKSLIQGRGSRAAHGVFELNFKIYEPNGFTLFDRLYLATQQYTGVNPGGPKNYLAQNFLMVIKFYGYDDAGNLMRPSQQQKTGPNSDANAAIEKWYPFQFTGIKTRFQNKITEYDCSAAVPSTVINGGQARGTIPYNVQLTATTVKDLLFGTAQFGATTGATEDNSRTGANNTSNVDAKSRASNPQSGWATANANAAKWASRQEQAAAAMAVARGTVPAPEPTDGSYATLEAKRAAGAVAAQTSTNAPAKADAAPKTLISGLVDALNQYQRDLCTAKKPGEQPTYTYPDEYEIIIKDDILKNAKIVSPGQPNKALKPMTQAQTAAEAKLGSKQKVDNNSENKQIVFGTSIVQFIEQILRTSSYITDQQLYIPDGNNGEIKINGTPAQTVAWFHIGMEAQPLEYDYRRNDYAYKIIYSVSLYAITESKSDWFPDSVPRGTQKRYSYWFTGQNTQILDYTQELNSLYYMVMSGPSVPRKVYTDYREFDKRAYQPRSDESDQGNRNKTFEPAANFASSIYSPVDTFRSRLVIVGDPDWMQQGEIVYGIDVSEGRYAQITKDGSINFESQEPLYEIQFNKPVDYDLWTGLMDPSQTNFYANQSQGFNGEASESLIYRCYLCHSIFSRGKFTQELEGAQVLFQVKDIKKQDDTKRTNTGTATLTGPEYTNFRRSEIAAQNAAAGKTSWTTGFANALPTGARQDSPAAQLATTATTPNPLLIPSAPATPPTSGSQIIGPAASTNPGIGGAGGIGVGQPVSVEVYLTNGETVQVSGAAQIQALRQQGLLDSQSANRAASLLSILQSAANNPTTNGRSQLVAKENG